MQALVYEKYGTPDVLHIENIEKPIPKENEVLVKVKASSINDWDWHLVQGKLLTTRLVNGIFRPRKKILGVEISGEVESIGHNVTSFKIGDEVYGEISESGFGGFAEYVSVKERALVIKDSKISHVDAASIPHASMLAFQGLCKLGKIKEGQKVLINGAGGGVGCFAVQIANDLGVRNITGVDSDSKLNLMKSMGYEKVIDYRKNDFTKMGEKYDLILDNKTEKFIFSYLSSLKKNGMYISVGGSLFHQFVSIILSPLISILFKKKYYLLILRPNKNLDYISKMYIDGKIKCEIDGPYNFNEIPNKLKYFGEGKHKGKIVIDMDKKK